MMDTKYNPVNLLLDTYDYSSWFGKEESTDPAPESDKLKKLAYTVTKMWFYTNHATGRRR